MDEAREEKRAEWWKTAPDDPKEAKYVEVDRRVKLAGMGEEGAHLLREVAAAVAPPEKCDHWEEESETDEPCELCQGLQWTSELLRAIASQGCLPTKLEDRDPPQYKDVREKLDKFWIAMGRTVGCYPNDGVRMGEKLRNTMHSGCRKALQRQSDTGACGVCQLTLVVSGGLMTMGKSLAEAQARLSPSELASELACDQDDDQASDDGDE